MSHGITEDDRKFLLAVEECCFPVDKFDHRCHLKMAYIYLTDHDVDTTFELTKTTLLRLLEHNKVDATKYHVTITRAWVLAIKHFMQITAKANSADEFIDSRPEMLDAEIMMSHYSAEILFSHEARNQFVPPDRSPIPKYED